VAGSPPAEIEGRCVLTEVAAMVAWRGWKHRLRHPFRFDHLYLPDALERAEQGRLVRIAGNRNRLSLGRRVILGKGKQPAPQEQDKQHHQRAAHRFPPSRRRSLYLLSVKIKGKREYARRFVNRAKEKRHDRSQ